MSRKKLLVMRPPIATVHNADGLSMSKNENNEMPLLVAVKREVGDNRSSMPLPKPSSSIQCAAAYSIHLLHVHLEPVSLAAQRHL